MPPRVIKRRKPTVVGSTNMEICRTRQYFMPPTWTYGRRANTLERMEYAEDAAERAQNVYYPFKNKKEWDLGKFLMENMTQTQIATYLKLERTREMKLGPVFQSANKLRDHIKSLPGGPKWNLEELVLDGYPTKAPIRLLYRDGLEAICHLFGNPVFAHHMHFDGIHDRVKQGGGWQKEYSEFCSANNFEALHKVYLKQGIGGTIVGVILASDKTHVTTGTGGLQMHPVFLTISNIFSDMRQKATLHAWLFRVLHKRVGYRHFASGVTHVNQMTGQEHRDIQRTLVAVIAGKVSGSFLKTIHAIINFIYIAQYPCHTESTISAMKDALRKFHDNKHHILEVGARSGRKGVIEHFNIPKLELLQHFQRAVKHLGSLLQYTADVSEHLFITHSKHVFKGINHWALWDEECVHILDRQEKMRLFNLYTLLRDSDLSLLNEAIVGEDSCITNVLINSHPEAAWFLRAFPEDQIRGPQLQRNLFATSVKSEFWL
ncbi:hypothetical protein DXG01_014687 [Tephrocybe rancida]|nr:hypothetical protein DXG01_014687 [Tephrocybe rancida]